MELEGASKASAAPVLLCEMHRNLGYQEQSAVVLCSVCAPSLEVCVLK